MNAWPTIWQEFAPLLVAAPAWAMLLAKITAILLAAWLAHFALVRVNPRWRVLLWRLTAVSLMVLPPATLLLPAIEIRVATKLPIKERAVAIQEAARIPAPASVPAADGALLTPFHSRLPGNLTASPARDRLQKWMGDPGENIGPALAPAKAIVPARVTEKPSFITLSRLLVAIWLGGILVLACRLCLGYSRIRRLARSAGQAPPWACEECLRVAQAIGCRAHVEVLQSAEVGSPLLFGLRRPRLLLPAAMCEDACRGDLPAIFAHELAHVRSRDVPWNLTLHLISVLLWFHPFAWRVRRAHLAACELVSDAVSASFVGDVGEYCRTLARVAVHAYASIPATGIAMARRSSISRRLSVLKRFVFARPLRRSSAIGFGLATLLVVAVLSVLRFALAAPPPAEPAASGNTKTAITKTAEKEANLTGKQAEPTKSAAATPKTKSLSVLVLDPQGKPLADADVHSSIWTNEEDYKANRDYKTDAAGIARVELPRSYYIVRVWAGKKPLVTNSVAWEENDLAAGKRLPQQCTIRLEQGVAIGGRIVDEQGKPIAGVSVELQGVDKATTDAEGRWRIGGISNDPKANVSLTVFHPNYLSYVYRGEFQANAVLTGQINVPPDATPSSNLVGPALNVFSVDSKGQIEEDTHITAGMLRNEKATIKLKRGIIARGRVTDDAGKPIKGALVVRGDNPFVTASSGNVPAAFPADADGRFQLPAMTPGERVLTVIAPGWAPQVRRIDLRAGLPSQDFRLTPGKPIRLRIVDAEGKAIPKAYVSVAGWRGYRSLYNSTYPGLPDSKIAAQADKNGVWEWTWAPSDPVSLQIYARSGKGFAPCYLGIAGGGPPQTVTLKPDHRITLHVTDAVTGKPISLFTVIPVDVFRKDWLNAERINAKVGRDGQLDFLVFRTDISVRLRVEATGYRTQTGPEFRVGGTSPRTQDFRLQPSPPVAGVVLDAAGQPVAKAEVLLATPSEEARCDDAPRMLSGRALSNNHATITDDAGRFSFPDPDEAFTVVVWADAGFALAEFPAGRHDTGALRLQPWASVRGLFRDGGRPVRGATIILQPVCLVSLDRPRINAAVGTRTDAEGHFEFKQVPPVAVSVFADLGPSVPLDLRPGQQAELDLGGAGTVVKGKVTLSGKVPPGIDMGDSFNYLIRREPGIAPPPAIAGMGFDIRNGWQSVWTRTSEGRAYLSTLRHWFVKLAPDGTFRIGGVPPGEYDLAIEVYAKSSGDTLARKLVRVTVTAADDARGELALPEISATVVPAKASAKGTKVEQPKEKAAQR